MPDSTKAEVLQGTLDMLILKALARGRHHGYSIVRWIQATTADALTVEEGSLYPALHRMERRGWIASEWGKSDSNRRAKYYSLTAAGRAQLRREVHAWEKLVAAIALVLKVNRREAAP